MAEAERRRMVARIEAVETGLAELRASRAVLSKALYGRKSEQQETPRSNRRRGQQPGAPGHGRTPRPGLGKRIEVHRPPKAACVCCGCGTPYEVNGAHHTTLVEVEVKAHKRRIVRPRWRRDERGDRMPILRARLHGRGDDAAARNHCRAANAEPL